MTPTKKNDPPNPDTPRVLRGGCWYSTDPARVRATHRVTVAPANRNNYLGFRTSLTGRQPR